MNVAGPSQPRPALETRDQSTYEEDLMRMIAQMDVSDIDGLQASYGTRVRQGQALSDHEIAFALLMQNAQELADLDADWEVAQRLALEEGDEPANDPAPTSMEQVVVPQPVVKKGKLKKRRRGKLSASLLTTLSSSGPTPSSPSHVPTTTARAPRRATGHDCVICQDPIFEPEVLAPCGHFYDIGCITDLFRAATRDESLYPPRCCRQNIPLPQVRPHLTQALLTEFELKAQEFGTLKRVYCAAPACSRFLGPLCDLKTFTCPSPTCTMTTCGKCSGKYDEWYHNCTPDAEIEQVLTLSHNSGWSRCPGCAQMIELNMGCYHMTCRCKTEFCYLCRASWKNCTCPQWDEDRLFAEAEHRADAQWQLQAPRGVAAPIPAPPGNIRRATLRAHTLAIQPATRRAEATAPAPPPARTRTRNALAAGNARSWGASVRQRQPSFTANTANNRNTANTENLIDWATPDTEDLIDWAAPDTPDDGYAANTANLIDWASPDTSHDGYAGRERTIREIMERLRVDHDCQHTTWKYRDGGGSCESCFKYLPNYLFRCGECQMLSCNRCRRNRL